MSDTPQKTALFNPFNGHLEQLFSYIDVGDLGLPDIQRPFVWRDAKVRDLFDSLYRGFPIGSYLLWRNTANGRTHQIGEREHEHKDPNLLIIDGQQRLTALYSVFRGVAVKDENYEDRIMTIAFNPVTEEFRVADAATQRNPEFINNITDLFSKAMDNVRPTVEVRSRRVGGATYQIPVEVQQGRSLALAMRWLVNYAALRHEKTMALRLAAEILDAIDNRGGAVKKREDVHKMAKANQAFAHYRW